MPEHNQKKALLMRRKFLALLSGAIGSLFFPIGSFARRYWPVRTVEPGLPSFDPATWRLSIDGLIENQLSFSYEDLKKLPEIRQTSDLDCVERWSVKKINWQGISLKTILEMAKPQPAAQFLTFHCTGGIYSESLSMDQAQAPDVILAYSVDGKPLEPKHGGPLRLVVPNLWGYKSAKWVDRIELVEKRHLGYWSQRGYGPDAGPEKIKRKKGERVNLPES